MSKPDYILEKVSGTWIKSKRSETMSKRKLPHYILEKVRGALGLEEDDPSKDEQIERMSPKRILELCCQWELGDPSWASHFLSWAGEAGYEIKERE